MYISYKAHNRFTKETLLIVPDVDVYMFHALRSIPSCTTDMNLRSCILNRHKMRQSQIATIQESLPSHFVICRILWSWPWRHKLSPTTLKTCSGYLGEYPCSLLTWIPKVSFLPILALFHSYICLCACISVIKPKIDFQRKPYWYCPTSMCTCFLHWGVYPLALWTWIWEIAFWTVTKCDNHKLRQFRNPCRRILWFVAFALRTCCTKDMNLRSCILNRHKMRQSQIATIQESLPSHFVICRILWSWSWRHKLSPIPL